MKKLPLWADGALFGFFLVPLIFFLKIFCPLNSGCFVDPFLSPLFSPLLILEGLFNLTGNVSYRTEFFFIMFFWGIIGALFAYLGGKLFSKKNDPTEILVEKTEN